jgi:hypothetical protein
MFDIEITGDPLPQIEWLKDGKLINQNDEFNVNK